MKDKSAPPTSHLAASRGRRDCRVVKITPKKRGAETFSWRCGRERTTAGKRREGNSFEKRRARINRSGHGAKNL